MKVEIRSLQGHSLAVGSSGTRTITIDRSVEAGGLGLGFNGGELLLLAIGGCFSNDLYREAPKFGVQIKSVHIEVSSDWGGDPVCPQNVNLSAQVVADAPAARIRALVEHTSNVAEIPNSLRVGTEVNVVSKQSG